MSWLARLASGTPASVYVAQAMESGDTAEALALDPRIQTVATPRHAHVLLVAGEIPPASQDHLRRVHEQLANPSGTLWYRSTPLPEFSRPDVETNPGRLARSLWKLHQELHRREPEPVLLSDQPPAPWQGKGDYGQGGEGMMGGTPYGRPMAMTGEDIRDGLQLDALGFTVGPFFNAFPPGLTAKVTLQGDVIQQFSIQHPPYPQHPDAVFSEALQRPVSITRMELARARHHLHRCAFALQAAGLHALSVRVLRFAAGLHSQRHPQSRWAPLRRLLKLSGFTAAVPRGCGTLQGEQAEQAGGMAARAAGHALDARTEDTQYRKLGFSIVLNRGGDCRARWMQLLDEIEQSLALAGRAAADDVQTGPLEAVETGRGRWQHGQPINDVSQMLEQLLPGLEWSEAVAVINSLNTAAIAPEEGAP